LARALTVRAHAFGYNSAESEQIWMKSRALIRAVARTGQRGEFLFLFSSGKQRTILPISRRPNCTKFEHKTSIGEAMNPFGTEF